METINAITLAKEIHELEEKLFTLKDIKPESKEESTKLVKMRREVRKQIDGLYKVAQENEVNEFEIAEEIDKLDYPEIFQ